MFARKKKKADEETAEVITSETAEQDIQAPEPKKMKDLKTHPIDQVIYGASLFRESRAEILSGSTTYFIIIGFIPMLLCMAHIYAEVLGNPDLALKHLLSSINKGIPNLDKSIFQNIEKILMFQLSKKKFDFLNVLFLGLSGVGFAQSVYFGLMYISDYRKDDPLQEGLYSLFIGVAMGLYFTGLSLLMADASFFGQIFGSSSLIAPLLNIMKAYPIIPPMVFSLMFFTFFYKFMTPLKIRTIDGFIGACSFVCLFVLGQTLHWVYLHYFEKELIENFGSFHSLVAAVIWAYYLIGSFFLGASIAFSYGRMRNQILGIDINEELDEIEEEEEEDYQDEALHILEEALDEDNVIDISETAERNKKE